MRNTRIEISAQHTQICNRHKMRENLFNVNGNDGVIHMYFSAVKLTDIAQ